MGPLRVGPGGSERPALRDASERLAARELARIRAAVESGWLPAFGPGLRIGAPLGGIPAPVALGQPDPTPYLRTGDVMELEIDGLGRARQRLGAA